MGVALTRFPFLTQLSLGGRRSLEEGLDLRRFRPRELIVRKGDRVAGVYLVEHGTLRVYELGPTGKEQTLYWVGPGESCILAVNCVFSGLEYPAWVEVDENAAVIAIVDAATYRGLFATEPALQRFTFDVLSSRVIELTEALAEAGTLDVEQRIMNLLLRQCGEDGIVRLSQDRIARHVGTAREVVSRVLRNLARSGLVRGRRGSVDILDIEGLFARLGGDLSSS